VVDLQHGAITQLLTACESGEAKSVHELFHMVSPELRRIAGRLMRNERREHLLQPTGLVNEAFLRLFNGRPVRYQDSRSFFAASVREMRRVLTDYARNRLAQKRQQPEVGSRTTSSELSLEELVDLNFALDELQAHEPRAGEIVGLKFYAGLSIEEIAAALEISPRSVARTWEWTRAWLARRLRIGEDPD
jgi:RNA polymerase sigma-70 factor, ECF subfamily